MVKRETAQAIEATKNQMIAALYSNPNWDDKSADRAGRIKELEEHFRNAIELVYNPQKHSKEEIDWNNPFWAAHKRAKERQLELFEAQRKGTVQEAIDMSNDQAAARIRSRREIDQIA